METQEQKSGRVNRALIKITAILAEEHCELEPFILITEGNMIKKEINVVAKPLPFVPSAGPREPLVEPVVETEKPAEEGGTE